MGTTVWSFASSDAPARFNYEEKSQASVSRDAQITDSSFEKVDQFLEIHVSIAWYITPEDANKILRDAFNWSVFLRVKDEVQLSIQIAWCGGDNGQHEFPKIDRPIVIFIEGGKDMAN